MIESDSSSGLRGTLDSDAVLPERKKRPVRLRRRHMHQKISAIMTRAVKAVRPRTTPRIVPFLLEEPVCLDVSSVVPEVDGLLLPVVVGEPVLEEAELVGDALLAGVADLELLEPSKCGTLDSVPVNQIVKYSVPPPPVAGSALKYFDQDATDHDVQSSKS